MIYCPDCGAKLGMVVPVGCNVCGWVAEGVSTPCSLDLHEHCGVACFCLCHIKVSDLDTPEGIERFLND